MNALVSGKSIRPSDVLAVGLIVATFGVGVLTYDSLPAELLIHYTPPGSVYYGPETVPKLVGISIIPVLSVGVFAFMRGITRIETVAEQLGPIRPYYQLSILVVVGLQCLGQLALVIGNLL